jgi:hypothetical protein
MKAEKRREQPRKAIADVAGKGACLGQDSGGGCPLDAPPQLKQEERIQDKVDDVAGNGSLQRRSRVSQPSEYPLPSHESGFQ